MLVPARQTIVVFAILVHAAPLEPFDGANNYDRREGCDNDEQQQSAWSAGHADAPLPPWGEPIAGKRMKTLKRRPGAVPIRKPMILSAMAASPRLRQHRQLFGNRGRLHASWG